MQEFSYTDFPEDAVIICPKCGSKNFRTDKVCRRCEIDLNEAKTAYLRVMGRTPYPERVKAIKEIIRHYPFLEQKILGRLGVRQIPDDYYIDSEAFADIRYWTERVTVAKELEREDKLDEASYQYEAIGLAAHAASLRAGRTTIIREVVLIKCRYCGSLSPQGTLKCNSCGGTL